ncbi:uncharacterized protein NEMAJ01_1452 [Nematocida major]|uniref:uncharacterized protein n=1 Tax=Nematocida major TaxID=1912982 RepID=UPI002007449C|nr:uncharacterized protein NEMAJ01_1452 [Nematocida major]KAH9386556.1 hypothetical protein NEMAJ01_1452 [Nematocida major]
MKRAEKIERGKKELTPVFVSHENKLEFYVEHHQIKPRIVELSSLWNSYIELFREFQETLEEDERLEKAIEDCFEEINIKLQNVGEILFLLLDELESVKFHQKFMEFEKIQDDLCTTACSILYINKGLLTTNLLETLGEVEFSLYRCLTLGQKVTKAKKNMEINWIHPTQYEILKYLYKNCRYNLREYLIVYKNVLQSVEEQKTIMFDMGMAEQLYSGFLESTAKNFLPGNLIETHAKNYNEKSLEDKIRHHEESISQRKCTIDQVIWQHKRIIGEIDQMNWNAGKEAKNIINMEKSVDRRGDFSMKKMFSLFESASNRLKEYEIALSRFSKLVARSKKSESTANRLLQIKSLDFNYLIVEGNLKNLKTDVLLLYSASTEIYNRRAIISNRENFG